MVVVGVVVEERGVVVTGAAAVAGFPCGCLLFFGATLLVESGETFFPWG